MALTKVTGHVIKSDTNITSHNINSSGIITAVTFDGNVSGVAVTFTGDSTIGSLGITTNLNVGGISTFTGNIDVDGHTNLDNVSIAGVTTATGDVTLGNNLIVANNKRIKLNGTNTEIFDDTNLRIDTNGSIIIRKKTGYELMGRFVPDGEVDLYFNGTKRFETTNTGAVVSGILTVTGNMNVEGVLTYQDVTNIDSIGIVTARSGIVVQDDATFQTANGNNILLDKSDNLLRFGDNVLARFGNDNDLEMYHTGSTGYIKNTTGTLYIQDDSNIIIGSVTGSETGAKYIKDGAYELYHNNSLKFETTTLGAKISGNLELSSTYPSLTWTDTNHNSDFRITNNDGTLIVYDITRGAHVLDFKPTGDLHVRNDKGIYLSLIHI